MQALQVLGFFFPTSSDEVFRWLSTPGSSDAFILFFSEVVGMSPGLQVLRFFLCLLKPENSSGCVALEFGNLSAERTWNTRSAKGSSFRSSDS